MSRRNHHRPEPLEPVYLECRLCGQSVRAGSLSYACKPDGCDLRVVRVAVVDDSKVSDETKEQLRQYLDTHLRIHT